MKRNIELKARFANLDTGHETAKALGAALHAHERQRDTYFRVVHGRLKLRERWVNRAQEQTTPGSHVPNEPAQPSQLIWYHRADETQARPSDYVIVPVLDGEHVREVLAGALGLWVEVVKRRTIYLHDNVRIHLDDVAGLGTFLEFEAIVDESCDDSRAQAKLDHLVALFGIEPGHVVSVSYSDLLAGDQSM